MTVKELKRGIIEMSVIEKSYKLRMEFLSEERLFTDEFLINLYGYIENSRDRESYLDILNTEFRGDIPLEFIEFIEVILEWMIKENYKEE